MTPSARIVVTSTALAAICAVLSTALGGGEPSPAVGAERVAAAQAAASVFSVLRRARDERDRPSRAVVAASHGDAAHADRSRRARLPLASPDVRVLPREDDVCLLVELPGGDGFAGYGCAMWPDARAGRLHVTLSGGPDQAAGEALVVGLVPDGVESVGLRRGEGTERLTLSEGFYATRAQAPRAIIVGDGNVAETIDLSGLPGRSD